MSAAGCVVGARRPSDHELGGIEQPPRLVGLASGGAVTSFWGEIGKDRQQRARQQHRAEVWARTQLDRDQRRAEREETARTKASRAEQARLAREEGLAEAAARTTALTDELVGLTELLPAVVGSAPRTPGFLSGRVPVVEFVPPDLEGVGRRPSWADFAPPEAGLFGRRKYERAVAEAQAALAAAGADYDRRCAELVDAARRAHEAGTARARREHEQVWDQLVDGVRRHDPDAVAELVGAVIHALPPLAGLLAGGRALYQPEPREVVVEVDLPDVDVVPAERGWRYVVAHQRLDPLPRPDREKARLYADLISRITLAVMHACFQALDPELVETITFNGHVQTTDTATDRPAHPCLITITAARATFAELRLDHEKLDPPECLRFLGAELSPHPYARTHVEPFVDFDLARYRLFAAPEALVELDPRTDLLQMDPFDFERLVKDLFVSMGYRAWRTQDSHDDGIDAVAVREDRITPVECVIQAKRYRNRVPPHDLQALMGAMAENGTATHGVLVTTSWLSDRSRQRARAQRIATIEGGTLASLIEQHLGRKVVISTRPPRR
jgi:restriction system protein